MAVFKKYIIRENSRGFHLVSLYFSETPCSTVLYALGSYIEKLFPAKTLEDAKRILDAKIGCNIEINLYTFTIQEITNNVYKSFICDNSISSSTMKEIHAASIMEREEEKQKRIIGFTLGILQGSITGVRQDDNSKEVIKDPEKTFNISSFLNYSVSSHTHKDCCELFHYGNPDKNAIKKAILENKKKVMKKYNAKYETLF